MDRPILFSGPMVRALLDGRKTQTRRVAALKAGILVQEIDEWKIEPNGFRRAVFSRDQIAEPRFAVGDRLYVREAWRTGAQDDRVAPRDLSPEETYVGYEADCASGQISATGKFRQAMHMPRWASRLTLTVTDVRVQRLQEITNADAVAEGTPCYVCGGPLHGRSENDCHCFHKTATANDYRYLWDSLNEARGYGWETNPWVVAGSFTVERRNIDARA